MKDIGKTCFFPWLFYKGWSSCPFLGKT